MDKPIFNIERAFSFVVWFKVIKDEVKMIKIDKADFEKKHNFGFCSYATITKFCVIRKRKKVKVLRYGENLSYKSRSTRLNYWTNDR